MRVGRRGQKCWLAGSMREHTGIIILLHMMSLVAAWLARVFDNVAVQGLGHCGCFGQTWWVARRGRAAGAFIMRFFSTLDLTLSELVMQLAVDFCRQLRWCPGRAAARRHRELKRCEGTLQKNRESPLGWEPNVVTFGY